MTVAPGRMRDILNREEYVYKEGPLLELISLMAGAQGHRVNVGNTKQRKITRSTALVALNQLNTLVSEVLSEAEVKWDDYCREIALDGKIRAMEVEDVELHGNFERALTLFRKFHPNRQAATPENIALAIIEMAAREEIGLFGRRLEKAGADLIQLPQKLLEAIEAKEQNNQKEREDEHPTVWLLHYKDDDRPAKLFINDDPGDRIEWRSTRNIDDIKPGDPVIYWRDINNKTGDRGGLVGTGRFVGGISRSEETFDESKEKTITWHYYPTEFEELFPRNLLARDPLLKKTGLKMNWYFGSILKVPPEMANKVDAYLISNGRKGLFTREESDAALEVVFIDDAAKTDEDFLKRSDLAFVLAARLNRVWDETNQEAENAKRKEKESKFVDWARRFFNRHIRTGLFQRRKRTDFDKSFVVHIDAPWGGGKTTFANYLTRILNPYRIAGKPPAWLAGLPFHDTRFWPQEFRRPWNIVSFNAWQHQHLDPPWWCFYQAIRRQCFHAVRAETFVAEPVGPSDTVHRKDQPDARIPPALSKEFDFQVCFKRYFNWLDLWVRELSWRILNPKVKTLLFTFFLTWITALILYKFGLFKPEAFKKALSEGLKNSNNLPAIITTGLVIAFGGGTAIWSVFATLTESLLRGTPDAAKNYSLGSGDPFERFRIHFEQIVRYVERPILVVVDDIDRCKPNFVVDLLHGIQTILKSARVIFVLLGDRDWIEHAFANVHDPMKGIDVGPEHTFGGRFVEKAIQLSLVLPDVTPDGRTDYVRRVLSINDEVSQEGTATLFEDEKINIGKELDDILDTIDPLSRDEKAQALRDEIHANESLGKSNQMAFVKRIDRQLALRSASDRRIKQATQHRLVPIAPVLPANPRQIKRIINGIALFQEIARIEQEIQPGSKEWCKLALWVVIMTEWPKTWATLSTYPGLLDTIRSSGKKSTYALPDDQLTKVWVNSIKRNKAIMRLLDFSSKDNLWSGIRIDASTIEQFRAFMPAVGGEFLPKGEMYNGVKA